MSKHIYIPGLTNKNMMWASHLNHICTFKFNSSWEFLGGPVVMTWRFHCSVPGWGTKILQAPWHGLTHSHIHMFTQPVKLTLIIYLNIWVSRLRKPKRQLKNKSEKSKNQWMFSWESSTYQILLVNGFRTCISVHKGLEAAQTKATHAAWSY